MSQPYVFRATTARPSARVSSGLHPVSTIAGLRAGGEEIVKTRLTAAVGTRGLHRTAAVPSRRIDARRMLRLTIEPALSVGGISASPEPSPGGRPSVEEAAPLPVSPGDISPSSASPDPPPPAPDPAPLPTAAADPPPNTAAKPASAIARVELTIDSLRAYDLSRPIPIVVEALNERNYVAEIPELNISISASNPSEIIITLKERIAQVYDSLRLLKHLDGEQSRQLKVLESYIVKSRRGWLDRR